MHFNDLDQSNASPLIVRWSYTQFQTEKLELNSDRIHHVLNLNWGLSFIFFLIIFIYSCTHLIESIISQIVIVKNHQNLFRGLDALLISPFLVIDDNTNLGS